MKKDYKLCNHINGKLDIFTEYKNPNEGIYQSKTTIDYGSMDIITIKNIIDVLIEELKVRGVVYIGKLHTGKENYDTYMEYMKFIETHKKVKLEFSDYLEIKGGHDDN